MSQSNVLVYYITNENGRLKIYKVKAVDEVIFLEDYGPLVIAKGSSMAEALLNLEAKRGES